MYLGHFLTLYTKGLIKNEETVRLLIDGIHIDGNLNFHYYVN